MEIDTYVPVPAFQAPTLPDIGNLTLSDNKSIEYSTSTVHAIDFFTGIVRDASIEDIVVSFSKMWNEDPNRALQVLMNLRDPRNGKGEKRIPRVIMFLLKMYKPSVYNSFVKQMFVDYGCWKDILFIYEYSVKLGIPTTTEINIFKDQIILDVTILKNSPQAGISLVSKWAPNEKSHYNKKKLNFANDLTKALGFTPKNYRTTIGKLRKHLKVLETMMSSNNWDKIDFSHIPSIAHKNYKKAFRRDCNAKGNVTQKRADLKLRYEQYLQKLLNPNNNSVKINTTGIQPHNLIKDYYGLAPNTEDPTTEAQWKDLIQKIKSVGTFSKTIAVSDVSGSMNGVPMMVSIALGIVVSSCCESDIFGGKLITFSENPELFHVTGRTLREKVGQVSKMSWGYNTNIQKVFDMLLATALQFNLTKEQMVEKVFIFTDMQFDQASGNTELTSMQTIKAKFESHGYNIPKIICWNLSTSGSKCVPFQALDENVAMLSGFSSELLKQVMTSEDFTPMGIMNKVIGDYKPCVKINLNDKFDVNINDAIPKIKRSGC